MTLHISISTATDSKGNIVAYGQGASFSREELRRIRAPYRFELWASRGYAPIAVIMAKGTKEAREYARAKYRTRGLSLRRVTIRSRRV